MARPNLIGTSDKNSTPPATATSIWPVASWPRAKIIKNKLLKRFFETKLLFSIVLLTSYVYRSWNIN